MRALPLIVALALAACSTSQEAGKAAARDGGHQGVTSATVRDSVDQARVVTDLEFVAAERSPGSPHWQAVQDLCKARFEQYGLTVELFSYGTGVNVIGRRAGTSPDEVILSAHYDHILGCAGADDNATGVVGVLEAARVTAGLSFDRTLVLACWDEEERGLIGAEAYAARAESRGDAIHTMFSLEMLGFRSNEPNSQRVPTGFDLLFPAQLADLHADQDRANFLAVLPDTSARPAADALAAHSRAIGLRTLVLEITESLKSNPLASDVRRSDHAAFWDHDVPALLVSDTSEFRYDPYHCRSGPDEVANLDLDFLTANVKVSVGALVDTLGVRAP